MEHQKYVNVWQCGVFLKTSSGISCQSDHVYYYGYDIGGGMVSQWKLFCVLGDFLSRLGWLISHDWSYVKNDRISTVQSIHHQYLSLYYLTYDVLLSSTFVLTDGNAKAEPDANATETNKPYYHMIPWIFLQNRLKWKKHWQSKRSQIFWTLIYKITWYIIMRTCYAAAPYIYACTAEFTANCEYIKSQVNLTHSSRLAKCKHVQKNMSTLPLHHIICCFIHAITYYTQYQHGE